MKEKPQKQALRCAIYTRVSTDQGLEQDFNSLDAQREASEAYIKSQAHEGWRLIRDRYDDGGFSGGSMERPALERLLATVRDRRIDVIVVYKVDRLTRSLADFAKLVELFDEYGVSFVSVTQSFNTTTSMGRLTLNVLLSFAQFEREVTGERIRDKIAASKAKGMWMGGVVPLGYRVESRALHIVEEHAEIVRSLYRRYLAAGSVVRLKLILDAEALRLPIRVDGAGRTTGGGLISRGHIYKILSNPIYIGRIAHKGQVHEGQHPGIIDRGLWEQVQQKLSEHAVKARRSHQASDAMLLGKLYDDRGNRMTPTWARKGPKRWRYYVSQAAVQGDRGKAGSIARVPANEIESRVLVAIEKLHPLADRAASDGAGVGTGVLANRYDDHLSPDRRDIIRGLLDRVTVSKTTIQIVLSQDARERGETGTLSLPWTPPSPYRRREIIQRSDADPGTIARPMRQAAQTVLIKALGKAYRWLDALLDDPRQTIETIAVAAGKTERSVRMTLSLVFLAPDLVKAAVEGKLPRGVGLKRLVDLPMAWPDQWKALGLRAQAAPQP
jgi:site-specific DNA recombinase